ncbi:MAG: BrnT family toxin [Janthinobacterium lividum]
MLLDWDPRKRLSNLAKHSVDFASAEFFEWDVAVVYASLGAAEPRLVAYAPIASRLHALVFSIETRTVRVIGLRKANRREIKRYEAEA